MNLLIVEDERMTREGLTESIDWAQVGVTKVFSAENGEAGLFMAKRILPEIVLTDIRMPRMDGITMAGRIREILPECRIVFLSAYSEIDYYKAAIDLKAIRYLDKPVDPEQLRVVISEAVSECIMLKRYKSTNEFHHLHERQKLADAICLNESEEKIIAEYKRLKLNSVFKSKDFCNAIIVSFNLDFEGEAQMDIPVIASFLSEAVDYPNLHTIRHKNRVVLFLFTPTEISNNNLKFTCKKIQEKLYDHMYTIAVGKAFRGLQNANKSYNTAKKVVDKIYLYPWGEFVSYSPEVEKVVGISAYAAEKTNILHKLSDADEDETVEACLQLYDKLKTNKDLVYHKARELYFEIISEVFQKADTLHLQIKEEENGEAISWIVLIENYNLDELHGFTCNLISLCYTAKEEAKIERKQVLAIKNYIAKNFMDDSLSIGSISGYLHMSASHVCTMFKNETGDTINNYLTEYRLSKAKQYLRETLLTATEISSKVGYRDSSYFGRIFRKRVGMTPNEYRNQ